MRWRRALQRVAVHCFLDSVSPRLIGSGQRVTSPYPFHSKNRELLTFRLSARKPHPSHPIFRKGEEPQKCFSNILLLLLLPLLLQVTSWAITPSSMFCVSRATRWNTHLLGSPSTGEHTHTRTHTRAVSQFGVSSSLHR